MKQASPNAYLRTKVMTASPGELRLLLFDGAIRFAEQAREGLAKRNFEASYTGITRCQNILMELINGLRPEYDPALCEKLSALYTFMYMQLLKASTERQVDLIDDVLKLLRYERETWQMLLDQLTTANQAATSMTASPQASAPLHAPPTKSDHPLIGATVSVKG